MASKVIFIFLFFTFVFSTTFLPGEVLYFDCRNRQVTDIYKEPYKSWKNSVDNIIDNPELLKCLPGRWQSAVNTWLNYAKTGVVVCKDKLDKPVDCANIDPKEPWKMIVPEENNAGNCGCREATIFHELMHMGAGVPESNENDHRIRGCEKLLLARFFPGCNNLPGMDCECEDENGKKSPCK